MQLRDCVGAWHMLLYGADPSTCLSDIELESHEVLCRMPSRTCRFAFLACDVTVRIMLYTMSRRLFRRNFSPCSSEKQKLQKLQSYREKFSPGGSSLNRMTLWQNAATQNKAFETQQSNKNRHVKPCEKNWHNSQRLLNHSNSMQLYSEEQELKIFWNPNKNVRMKKKWKKLNLI